MLWGGGSSVWRRLVPPRCPASTAGRAGRAEKEVVVGGGSRRQQQQHQQQQHYQQQQQQRVESLRTAMAAQRVCIIGSGNWWVLAGLDYQLGQFAYGLLTS